jgi:hypothetical protein
MPGAYGKSSFNMLLLLSVFQGNFDVMSPVYDRYLAHMLENHGELLRQLMSKGTKDNKK